MKALTRLLERLEDGRVYDLENLAETLAKAAAVLTDISEVLTDYVETKSKPEADTKVL